ncbi:MAG: efflux RND transporter permease subunit, partial [Bacillales bacterium]
MWLAKTAIRRPVLTVVFMIIVLALGAVSLTELNMDLIPDIHPPVGAVVASYPGAGPDEVLEKVTKPLEQRLGTLAGLKTIQSQTQEGLVLILLEFEWSEDINDKQNDVISRINQVDLPSDVDTPTFLKFDPSSIPIMQLSVMNGDETDELREEVDDIVQSLTNLSGVASADESGLLDRQIKVELDPEEMDRLGLSHADIQDVLEANHLSLPGGVVQDGDDELTTRVIGELPDVDALKDVLVTVDPATGEDVTLSDIASVDVSTEDRTLITRTNEEPSVNINVYKQSGENTAAVAAAVHDEIEELQDELDVEIVTIFDQGEYVERAVGNVSSAMISGGILAMLVLFLILRSFKSPLMIGVSIPFSVIVTF